MHYHNPVTHTLSDEVNYEYSNRFGLCC